MKRILILLVTAFMLLSLTACDGNEPISSIPTDGNQITVPAVKEGILTVLFTGGLDGVYAKNDTDGAVGYAALAAFVDQLEDDGHAVVLIDGGNSCSSENTDKFWKIVNACSYDIRIPGAMELSSGVDAFMNRAESLNNCSWISCNLVDLESNTTVFDPYVLLDVGNVKVGFVGVTQPQALVDTDLHRYGLIGQEGGQALRDVVQEAVDQAAKAGADSVVVVGNLGTALEDTPWTTVEVISGITGMDAWLDCGSGAVLDGDTVVDKDEFEIPLCAPGSGFKYIGRMELNLNDGTTNVKLLTELEKEDRTVRKQIEDYDAEAQ